MREKILVIEDDPLILEALEDILTLEDYEVITAEDGKKGLEKALMENPDLIISDIMMPVMDGYELLKNLRENPAAFAIPFLFLTARAEKSDQRFGMELGADDYITKPFENDDILKAVKARLDKRSELEKHFNKKIKDLQLYITSSLPHELRSPLNVILGFSQIIDSSNSGEIGYQDLKLMNKNILEAGKRLLRIVINYTYYTKLTDLLAGRAGNDDEDITDIKISSNPMVVIEEYTMESALRYNRGENLVLDLNNASIFISEEHLIKIIEEITDNAFKFSYPETQVTIKSYISDDYYNIEFINQGRGMSPGQINRVGAFLQFQRDEFEQQGSGLGLAIVGKIIELYDGKWKIESIEDEFLKITVSLHLKQGHSETF